jgi:integrase
VSIPQQGSSTLTALKPWQVRTQELDITAGMSFEQAAEIWMQTRILDAREGRRLARYVRENTEKAYRRQIKSLRLFFEGMRLLDIRLDHIRRYQIARVNGDAPFIRRRRPHEEPGPCRAKPAQVNTELNALIRILKRARLWTVETEELYEPLLEEESETPRALTPQEQNRWLAAAQSHQRWQIVYWYSLLAFATCMSTNELRALRLGDISMQSRTLVVPWEGSKNRHRHRTIPIGTPEAWWALERLTDRAHRLASCDPHHYLFPFRDHRFVWHPDKPAAGQFLKRPWEEVRDASGLTWFRPYDTRHTAITRLAEAGTPLAVIMSMAGHISPKMTAHYTHISQQLQLQAVQRAQRLLVPQHYAGFTASDLPPWDPRPEPSIMEYQPQGSPQTGRVIMFPGGRR